MKTKGILFLVAISFVLSCKKQGCTDEYAVNYDANAKKDDNRFCVYKKPEGKDYFPDFGANTATIVSIDMGIVYAPGKYSGKYFKNRVLAGFREVDKQLYSIGKVHVSLYVTSVGDPSGPIAFRELNRLEDNSYLRDGDAVFQYQGNQPKKFPNPMVWKSYGEEAWPAFLLENDRGFSSGSVVVSGQPSTSSPYKFSVKPVSDADSLVLQIIGQRKELTKVIPGTASSYVFSQKEMESVGKGDAILRVIPVTYNIKTEGGKTYYFLNQMNEEKEVRIE